MVDMTVKSNDRFTDANEVGRIIAEQGYEWDEFHAWFFDGRLWYAQLGGCSCDSWDCSFTQDMPEPVNSTHELFKAASKYCNDTYGADLEDYTRFIINVNTRMKEIAAAAGVE